MYFVAQLLGALVGAAILSSVTIIEGHGRHLCTPVPASTVSAAGIFGYELTITFVLVLTFFASADIGRSEIEGFRTMGPLAIGLAVAISHFWAVRTSPISFVAVGSFCILIFVILTLLSFYSALA